jgi:hypothetical protein
LVCFNEDVRATILLDIIKIKDKATKKVTEKLKERTFYQNEAHEKRDTGQLLVTVGEAP